MRAITFISTQPVSQPEFAAWVRQRPASDSDHYELLDGYIVREPPAQWPHGEIETNLLGPMIAFVHEHRLGRIFGSSQGFELPSGDTVEPDISFVSKDRWVTPSRPGFLRIAPSLVVEILSRSTRARDRGQKRRIYERNAVDEYWLVDPPRCEVVRSLLVDGRFDAGTVSNGEQRVVSDVLPGFSIAVDAVFR